MTEPSESARRLWRFADLEKTGLASHPVESLSVTAVMILCARWCGVCRGFEQACEAFMAEPAAAAVDLWLWVDVEDAADVLPSLDVETFPTLVIIQNDRLTLGGPLRPELAALRRALDKALRDPQPVALDQTSQQEIVRLAAAFERRRREDAVH
ncbi:MAG: thioredoxin domain-containing protein [Burkholderiaceae bacterium]|jgi:hypothetical protein